MRVHMVSEHASPLAAVLGSADAGGQNVFVAALAGALARRGVEVVVHTRRDDEALPPRLRLRNGVEVDHVDAGPPCHVPKDELLPHMDAFGERLHRCWVRERPDIVHAHFWMSGYASLAAARPLGIPVAQTFHALGVVKRRHQGVRDTSPADRLRIERDVAQRVDRVLATCSDEVFELLRLGVDRRRVTIVPGGVDLDRFGADGPREDVPAAERPRVLALGRLVERKGFGNVIEAIAEVPDAHLVIAGGPERSRLSADAEAVRLARLAKDLGAGDRVELRGCVDRDHVAPLIRSADVLVSVPWYEPFGIVPVEAMACGVPVIVSAVGGLTDTVVHGLTGVHVPPRRPDRLAEALRELLADPARRAKLGAAGARRARERYGWNRIAGQTLRAYARLAAGGARAAARKGGPR